MSSPYKDWNHNWHFTKMRLRKFTRNLFKKRHWVRHIKTNLFRYLSNFRVRKIYTRRQRENWEKNAFMKLRDTEWCTSRNTSKFWDKWWRCRNKWGKWRKSYRTITVVTVVMIKATMVVAVTKVVITVGIRMKISRVRHHK